MTSPFPHVPLSGTPGRRAPVALLHGFLESPALWQAMPARFWDGQEVVALPLPGHAPWRGSHADLHALGRPVHAIICDRDPVVRPRHQLQLISSAPKASAAVLKSGHLPMLETPLAFERAFLAWRDRHGAAPRHVGNFLALPAVSPVARAV